MLANGPMVDVTRMPDLSQITGASLRLLAFSSPGLGKVLVKKEA